MDIALELHQQKINRQEFDRTLKGKPQVLGPNTQLPKAADTSAAPDPTIPQSLQHQPHERRRRKRRRRKRTPKSRQHLLPKARARARAKVIQLRGEPLLVEQEEVGRATLLLVLSKHVVRVR